MSLMMKALSQTKSQHERKCEKMAGQRYIFDPSDTRLTIEILLWATAVKKDDRIEHDMDGVVYRQRKAWQRREEDAMAPRE